MKIMKKHQTPLVHPEERKKKKKLKNAHALVPWYPILESQTDAPGNRSKSKKKTPWLETGAEVINGEKLDHDWERKKMQKPLRDLKRGILDEQVANIKNMLE